MDRRMAPKSAALRQTTRDPVEKRASLRHALPRDAQPLRTRRASSNHLATNRADATHTRVQCDPPNDRVVLVSVPRDSTSDRALAVRPCDRSIPSMAGSTLRTEIEHRARQTNFSFCCNPPGQSDLPDGELLTCCSAAMGKTMPEPLPAKSVTEIIRNGDSPMSDLIQTGGRRAGKIWTCTRTVQIISAIRTKSGYGKDMPRIKPASALMLAFMRCYAHNINPAYGRAFHPNQDRLNTAASPWIVRVLNLNGRP
jgi:hypothetical protein